MHIFGKHLGVLLRQKTWIKLEISEWLLWAGSTILESFLALRKKHVFSIYTRVILRRTTFRATRGTSSSITYPESVQTLGETSSFIYITRKLTLLKSYRATSSGTKVRTSNSFLKKLVRRQHSFLRHWRITFIGQNYHAWHTRKESRISKAAVGNCGKGVGNFYLS